MPCSLKSELCHWWTGVSYLNGADRNPRLWSFPEQGLPVFINCKRNSHWAVCLSGAVLPMDYLMKKATPKSGNGNCDSSRFRMGMG